jgi:uncharacterized repeat protein (TIGR01451 family)
MDNRDRLPIVLSMACMTGWYDNITEPDQTGSYDCFAEQMVNTSGGGAIACLASPRASDGGMFRTLTKSIYRAAFTENCVFIGETIALAKLLHIQDGESVDYARHFNLFGDPALLYRWYAGPTEKPELVVRPHEIVSTPELPAIGDNLTLEITVRNTSTLTATNVLLRVTDISAAGSYSQKIIIPSIGDWSSETVTVVIPALAREWHMLVVTVDPDRTIDEIDESNNTAVRYLRLSARNRVPGGCGPRRLRALPGATRRSGNAHLHHGRRGGRSRAESLGADGVGHRPGDGPGRLRA